MELPLNLKNILEDHYETIYQFRKLLMLRLTVEVDEAEELIDKYNSGEINRKELFRHFTRLRPMDLDFLSKTLDRLIKGEREALGLDLLQNQDAAYNALKADYVILPKQEYERLMGQ